MLITSILQIFFTILCQCYCLYKNNTNINLLFNARYPFKVIQNVKNPIITYKYDVITPLSTEVTMNFIVTIFILIK